MDKIQNEQQPQFIQSNFSSNSPTKNSKIQQHFPYDTESIGKSIFRLMTNLPTIPHLQSLPTNKFLFPILPILLLNFLLINFFFFFLPTTIIPQVSCQQPTLNGYEMGIVNSINNKIRQIKNQIIQQILIDIYKNQNNTFQSEKQQYLLFINNQIQQRVNSQIKKYQIQQTIQNKTNQIVYFKSQIQQKVDQIIKQSQQRLQNMEKQLEKMKNLVNKELEQIKQKNQQHQKQQKQTKQSIETLKESLNTHQISIKDELDKRDHQVNQWKQQIVKEMKEEIQSTNKQHNEKHTNFEKSISDLKQNLNKHQLHVNNQLDKRDHTVNTIKQQMVREIKDEIQTKNKQHNEKQTNFEKNINDLKENFNNHQTHIKNQFDKRDHTVNTMKQEIVKEMKDLLKSEIQANNKQHTNKHTNFEKSISDLKQNLTHHQTQIKNQLDKRDRTMNTLKQQIAKQIKDQIQVKNKQHTNKHANFEKSITDLKDNLNNHQTHVKNQFDKRDHTSNALRQQIVKDMKDKLQSHNNNILKVNSNIKAILQSHNNTLSQHKNLYSALSYYFSIPLNYSSSTPPLFQPHTSSITNSKTYQSINPSIYPLIHNISKLQTQYNKLNQIVLSFLEDYDKSPCKTSNVLFKQQYVSSTKPFAIHPIQNTEHSFFQSLKSFFRTLFNYIQSFFSYIFNIIKSFFSYLLNIFQSIFSYLPNAIQSFFSYLFNGLSSIFSYLFNAISSLFSYLFNAISSFFGYLFNAISSFFSYLFHNISSFFSYLFDAISSFFSYLFHSISSFFISLFNIISQPFTAIKNLMISISTKIKSIFTFNKSTNNNIQNNLYYSQYQYPHFQPQNQQSFVHQDQYVSEIMKKRQKQKNQYQHQHQHQQSSDLSDNTNQDKYKQHQSKLQQFFSSNQNPTQQKIYQKQQISEQQKLKLLLRYLIILVTFISLSWYLITQIKQKQNTTFKINKQCQAMWCYRIRQKDRKIIFQPTQQDIKTKRNLSNLLHLKPTIQQMCTILQSTHCCFKFQISKTTHLNISIGITALPQNNKNIIIYLTGKSGKVYQNGQQVPSRQLTQFTSPTTKKNKTAYLNPSTKGFTVKDIVSTQVDIEKGMIQWTVNSKIIAQYYSDDIQFVNMVPFISLLDFYDEALFLDR